MVTFSVGYHELSPSLQSRRHAPMRALMAFNTQHLAIVGQYVVMYNHAPIGPLALPVTGSSTIPMQARTCDHRFRFCLGGSGTGKTIAANLFADSGQRIKVRRKASISTSGFNGIITFECPVVAPELASLAEYRPQ